MRKKKEVENRPVQEIECITFLTPTHLPSFFWSVYVLLEALSPAS
jgi:hypothetical protein